MAERLSTEELENLVKGVTALMTDLVRANKRMRSSQNWRAANPPPPSSQTPQLIHASAYPPNRNELPEIQIEQIKIGCCLTPN